MGGRGAVRGGGGGGDGLKNVTTSSLMSERESKRAEVDEAMSVFSAVQGRYGVQVEEAQIAKFKGRSNTLAYFDYENNIAINDKYLDSTKMTEVYDDCVSAGFHPSRGNKTGLQAVVAHECGHMLTGAIAIKEGRGLGALHDVANDIVHDALKNSYFKSVGELRKSISGYADHNNAETLAEAYADYYCNGDRAKPVSMWIVHEMRRRLK